MSKSRALTGRDFRTILRLAGECREMGDDPVVWRVHFFAETANLIGAGLALGGEMAGCRTGQNVGLGVADWGWQNGFNPAGWVACCNALRENPDYSNLLSKSIQGAVADDGVCLGRPELITDDEWYRCEFFQKYFTTMGVDMALHCFHSIPGKPDEFTAIMLYRRFGEGDFTPRDRSLVREMNSALAQFVGGPLSRFSDPSPTNLSPRVRQVLRCLLEGDGDKQIATRLVLSPYTVNQYTKVIFTFFGVQSRAELLARWIRRGWANKCSWIDWDDGDKPRCVVHPSPTDRALG
jgi:DNA-binding CsgD family transcriptional regulator